MQFVINDEEGDENRILHGNTALEVFLSEVIGAPPLPRVRHMNMMSIDKAGSHVGICLDYSRCRGFLRGFSSGDPFFAYFKDTFDGLYAACRATPQTRAVGLHCRFVGRPG